MSIQVKPEDLHPYVSGATRIVRFGNLYGIEIQTDSKHGDITLFFADENALQGFANRLVQAVRAAC